MKVGVTGNSPSVVRSEVAPCCPIVGGLLKLLWLKPGQTLARRIDRDPTVNTPVEWSQRLVPLNDMKGHRR